MNVKNFAAAVALAAGATVAAAPVASADAPWLAIAYSPQADVFGWETIAKSPIEAINLAMDTCKKFGGTDCRVLVTNQGGCVAIAKNSGNDVKGGRGPDRNAAARDAFNNVLGGGRILTNDCVGD